MIEIVFGCGDSSRILTKANWDSQVDFLIAEINFKYFSQWKLIKAQTLICYVDNQGSRYMLAECSWLE